MDSFDVKVYEPNDAPEELPSIFVLLPPAIASLNVSQGSVMLQVCVLVKVNLLLKEAGVFNPPGELIEKDSSCFPYNASSSFINKLVLASPVAL